MLINHQNDSRQFVGYSAVQVLQHTKALARAAAYWHNESLKAGDTDLGRHYLRNGQAVLCCLQAARDHLAKPDVAESLAFYLPMAIAAGNTDGKIA
jgi:hypothetical protein